MKILSIQSSVAYGHVGNSAAVFPLQRLGHEVWPVYTVHFSNHTGYGAWRGPLLAADDVRDVITGIEERGVLGQVDAVLSGYQGGEEIGDVILDAVARVKAANPAATYTCDPVMGNAKSGCFVHPAIPVLLRERVVPQADLITPTSSSSATSPAPSPPTSRRRSRRPTRPGRWDRRVLVTSVERPAPPRTDRDAGGHPRGRLAGHTPRLPLKANGSGDVTAALFTGHYRSTGDAADARADHASVWDLLHTTHESGERELQLVESQEYYAEPRMQFEVTQVR